MAVATDSPKLETPPEADLRGYDLSKSIVEVVFSILLLVALFPLLVLLGVLVKLTSPGPILYSQLRLGRQGRSFRIYKLRTMRHNCEAESGICWSRPGDPRVTVLGRLLRCTHLDELPQLWNVICRDMSLVGPRPERPEIVRNLEKAIPFYRERLAVRPGVTGLAQIHLPPDTDLESVRRKVSYDLYYIRERGPWMDVRIVFCTALHLAATPYQLLSKLLTPRVEIPEVTYPVPSSHTGLYAGMETAG